jgi:hypothetical protein
MTDKIEVQMDKIEEGLDKITPHEKDEKDHTH